MFMTKRLSVADDLLPVALLPVGLGVDHGIVVDHGGCDDVADSGNIVDIISFNSAAITHVLKLIIKNEIKKG